MKNMTISLLAVALGLFVLCVQAEPTCYVKPPELVTKLDWPDMDQDCIRAVKEHIKKELDASFTYIAMGAHFLNAANFRPGVAKLFLTHAGEERQHAKALIDYILLRGYEITKDEIPTLKPLSTTWDSVLEALNTTLTIERSVRDDFKRIIYTCEGGDDAEHKSVDYHISDFLTGNFLDEQHQGVHEISNHVSTLARILQNRNTAFAEIEFDRTLLKAE